MPPKPSSEVQSRREFDRTDRRFRTRSMWTMGVSVVAVFAAAAAFWFWDRQEAARDGAPNWSPDGQSIVFAAEVGTAKGDIFVMDADGGGRRALAPHPANESNPAMSPDGTRIAFESDRDGNPEIYVMDRSGRNVQRLTTDPARDLAPAWSPDSKRLAFTSDRDARAAADVYVMNADGSGVDRMTSDMANWAPQFSPDGRQLAVQIDRDVWVIDVATRQKRRLTVHPANGMNPTWSADGSRLAFVTTRNRKAEIFTMKPDGTDATLLVSMAAGSVIDPRWSPTGTHIAFVMVPDAGPGDASAARTEPDAAQAIYTIELSSEKLTRVSR
jgi:Tol biopolymer transport system component